MKKLGVILGLCSLVSLASADSILQGSIIEVKDASKSIVIDTIYQGPVEVKVLPSTRIELDDCGFFGMDNIFEDGDFGDLKIGRHAEVDGYYPTNVQVQNTGMPIARKIEVKCYKQAY
ncbi:hypothetical protein CAV_1462 [Campylobacter avium LMG 24591]|uniref:Uncharacterized protein n=1 Tax=Campylobacter avium LMG 24591 TaxID=522484 RepID=A0A222MZR5_9BACT|nr:hypothetical protein [Campylobacter avium]ASQ31072.1 hypothetical protein CAV_1462 [Campylobacter avium LMG 24591]OYD78455.1 hypothetical protein CAV8706_1458 [Campylobacter avium]HJE66167.1 hypothetical protein [Campylobacter avium]